MTDATTSTWDRRAAIVGAVLVAVGVLVAVAVKARCGLPAGLEDQYLRLCYSDIVPLWSFEGFDRGAAPYLEHAVEYPPLTGLWMWLAAWPSDSAVDFFWWNTPILVVSGAVTGALLGGTWGLRGPLVVALAPTLWVSGALNWDLPTLVFASAAVVAHRRARDGWAGVAIGLGTAAKLWPVLLLPGVLLGAAGLRGRRAAVTTVTAAGLAWSAVNLPVMLSAPRGWARFFELSRERGADWDSLWRLLGDVTGSRPDVATLNVLVSAVTLLGIAAFVTWTLRRDEPASWHLVGLPIVAWFLLAGKVWSPQFSLWLLPLLAFCRPGVPSLVAFAAADLAVTITRFPYIGGIAGIEDPWPAWPFEIAVAVRAVVVLVVAISVWRRAVAHPVHRSASDPPRPDDATDPPGATDAHVSPAVRA